MNVLDVDSSGAYLPILIRVKYLKNIGEYLIPQSIVVIIGLLENLWFPVFYSWLRRIRSLHMT